MYVVCERQVECLVVGVLVMVMSVGPVYLVL